MYNNNIWSMPIQTVALAGPVSYNVDGEHYIAVNAGWDGGRAQIARLSANEDWAFWFERGRGSRGSTAGRVAVWLQPYRRQGSTA